MPEVVTGKANSDIAEVIEPKLTNISYPHVIVIWYIFFAPVISRLFSLTKLIGTGDCLTKQLFPTSILYHILGGHTCAVLFCLLPLIAQSDHLIYTHIASYTPFQLLSCAHIHPPL